MKIPKQKLLSRYLQIVIITFMQIENAFCSCSGPEYFLWDMIQMPSDSSEGGNLENRIAHGIHYVTAYAWVLSDTFSLEWDMTHTF